MRKQKFNICGLVEKQAHAYIPIQNTAPSPYRSVFETQKLNQEPEVVNLHLLGLPQNIKKHRSATD